MENIIAIGLIILLIAGITAIVLMHHKDVKAKRILLGSKRMQLMQCSVVGGQISHAKTFDDLFKSYQNMVKYLFDYVVRCPSVRADEYGIFRSHGDPYKKGDLDEGLKTITKDEIFLGNIYGLWTFPLSEWEKSEDKDAKLKIFNQFRSQLYSGYRWIEDELRKDIRKISA